ncbi:hypothetical protein [Mesobacillus subterraneus]|nr:hypothetical protein [Mesobacillus subterraneus]
MTKDQIHSFNGISILIHEGDNDYFTGTELDYVRDPFGLGKFKLIRV